MALARSFNKAAAALLAALVLVVLGAGAALAQNVRRLDPPGWSLCNETSYVLEAATGRPDGRAILVQGWVRIRPGECKLAVSAPLARGTHYLFARTSAAHRGGRKQWGGDATLCVDPNNSSTLENPPQCAPMGLEDRRFRRVQINRRESWRTSFAEAEPYTLPRAQAAGIQRLLKDAGYEPRQGRGGVDPREVSASIAQFRAAARIAPNTSIEGLVDALEIAARRRSQQLGLTLCNRTNSRIWTAVARRRSDGWESRGWWALGAGGCARTIDEALLQEVYYIHAVMETPDGDRYLAAGGEPFCTSPSRFAILGRAGCDARFYHTDLFTKISSQGRPGLIVEFSPREFLAAGERPRQIEVQSDAPDTIANDRSRAGRRIPAAAPRTGQAGGR
jgi:uncharacterized membrane protein